MINAPKTTISLFWDTPVNDLEIEKHCKYIIERVLEYGDLPDLEWLFVQYPHSEIIDTIKRSKRLSAKSAHFFAMLFNIPEETVECIRNPYTQKQHRF